MSDLKVPARNNFTLEELKDALEEENGQVIQTDWVKNPNYEEEYKAWRADPKGDNYPSYYIKDKNGDFVVDEEKLVTLGERGDSWWHEPDDYLHNFGHFKSRDSWNLGDGHECGIVFEHVESGRLFRKTGWYSSWDSGEWDGPLTEVEAVEYTSFKYRDLSSEKVHEYPLHVKE